MGLTTLFFGQHKQTKYGFLTADLLKSEKITMAADVTKHPVEFGFEITDHVILKPYQIQSTFYISDSHIKASSSNISRVAIAYEILKFQRLSKLPFSYVSNLQIFPFCIATNIGIPRSAGDGDSISFELTIQPIQVLPPLGLPFPGGAMSLVAGAALASLVLL